ncbi:hypothetical protein SKAU_G00089770 [Synaphobranchus kaupii]|uniref:THAP-type domain-containing protein n=1 Tax=Synaphobranchus kaupii TaxID=118154 RepID=A0A9Q1FW51_SYNKA|nr:hypothetical protein SKAU_G00089770 [Synaphobranchus kaupii]
MLQQWLVNMRRAKWSPTSASRLCSDHFEEHFFFRDSKALDIYSHVKNEVEEFERKIGHQMKREGRACN